ncbi:MAG: hypothetical protein ABIR98_15135 [Usitatibacter sp.]
MKLLRRFGFALWLALALAVGQHSGLLHGLAHASEKATQKQDSKPAPSTCDQCSLCAQLVGASATPPTLTFAAADLVPAASPMARAAPALTRVVFRSRAPPVLL